MPAQQSSAILFRLWAALLLAIIGLQASAPPTAAFQLSHGSAFSADTYEVAVARPRNDDSRDAAVMPLPLDPWLASPDLREVPLLRRSTAGGTAFAAGPAPTGQSRFWRPATRAPPFA